jgi:hypothetical protein
MALPNFDLMWTNFPDHTKYPTLRDLHNFIGGTLAKNIDIPGFGANGNTCAVRLSRALNYGSMPISGNITKSLKISTMTGGDGKLYIFRVREMKAYLAAALAVTPVKVTDKFGEAFSGKRGLVSFDVSGWSDASGHVALWDGSDFREPHDDYRNLSDNPLTPVIEGTTQAMTLWEI